MTTTNLDNRLVQVIWHTLAGEHARFSAGDDVVRRYMDGFAPICAFADPSRPDFDALAGLCAPGEQVHGEGWHGDLPAGWRLDFEAILVKMVYEGEAPTEDPAPEAVKLGEKHASQALKLATAMSPGPFSHRTLELGDYYGLFNEGELIAMAGERFAALPYREISGVCTHTQFQGKGLARRLMMKLVRCQISRGERPFLHVLGSNELARGLYERIGFVYYCESVLRVVTSEGIGDRG